LTGYGAAGTAPGHAQQGHRGDRPQFAGAGGRPVPAGRSTDGDGYIRDIAAFVEMGRAQPMAASEACRQVRRIA
jgi:hypothetical protein